MFQTDDPQGTLVSHIFNIHNVGGGRVVFVHTFEDRLSFSKLEAIVEDVRPQDLLDWMTISLPQVTTPEQAAEETVGYFALTSYSGLFDSSGVQPPTTPVHLTTTVSRNFSVVGASAAPSIAERLEALLMR